MRLKFNRDNPIWMSNEDYNHIFVTDTMRDINILIRNDGYIYLNKIYEMFAIRWDPFAKENLVFTKPLIYTVSTARSGLTGDLVALIIEFKEAE